VTTETPAPTTVSLFSSLAVQAALRDVVLPGFTASTGIRVDVTFDPTTVHLRNIAAGARPDVLTGVSASFEPLIADGIVDGSSVVPIARSGMGIAVGPGQPAPDISSTEALVRALLQARSVAYSRTGASGIFFAGLIERLGIAEQVNERATVVEKGFTAEAIIDGRADLAIQQLSELMFVPEAQIVGPLPDDVQQYTEFSAALGAHAAQSPAAAALLDALGPDSAGEAYVRSGLALP